MVARFLISVVASKTTAFFYLYLLQKNAICNEPDEIFLKLIYSAQKAAEKGYGKPLRILATLCVFEVCIVLLIEQGVRQPKTMVKATKKIVFATKAIYIWAKNIFIATKSIYIAVK